MPIKMTTITPGSGPSPAKGRTCKVHYVSQKLNKAAKVGTLTDGSEFDSSRKRGDPFSFKLGASQVIKGWDEAVAQMSKGQKCKVEIPPELGYGSSGYPPVIPANATLNFEIELLDF